MITRPTARPAVRAAARRRVAVPRRGRGARWSACAVLALAATLVLASGVWAHALLRRSDPESGAALTQPPAAVTLSFTEQPDPSLSIVHVLDSTGAIVDRGGTHPVAGQPDVLTLPLGPLPPGVYTVSWRTVSAVDGHVTGGAFAFGVGQTPPAPRQAVASTAPPPSVGYVASRVAWYAGLSGLLGAAWVWTIAFREPPTRRDFLWASWAFAAAGVVGLGLSQATDVGVGMGRLLATALGQALWWRAAPIAVCGAALAVSTARAVPTRLLLVLAGAAAAAATLAHVLAGHAAASPPPWWWPNVAAQWLHIVAVGAWLGGLGALLVALAGTPSEDAARAVRRFSRGAPIALAAVAATGVVRAVYEVGTWSAVFSSAFGRLVDLKALLLLTLAALGAVNHYRNVPIAARTRRGLVRVGAAELVIGAVVLGIAGYLSGLAPPRFAQEAVAEAPSLIATGNDFATSVRLRLEVTPGTVGTNRFTAGVTDYDSGRPVAADRVTLSFTKRDRPEIGASTLDLTRRADGTYQGDGTNLSLDGPWTISALVAQGIRSVTVPLTLTVRGQTVHEIRAPGQPTLYTIDLPSGRQLEVYLDPDTPGANEVHMTFIDAAGNELPVPRMASATVAAPGQGARPLPVRRFGPGHFIADATLGSGTWDLVFAATAATGDPLGGHLEVRLGP